MKRTSSTVCGTLCLIIVPLVAASCERVRGPPIEATAVADVFAPPDSPADLLDAGHTAYGDAAFQQAREFFEAAAAGGAEAGDARLQSEALLWSCLSSWRLVELQVARQACEMALAIELLSGLEGLTSQTRNALGLVAWEESRLVDALQHFGQAHADALALDDPRGIVRATGNLGLIQTDFGEFAAAWASFAAMRDGGRRLDLPVFEANALTNLGMLAVRTGDPNGAIETLEEARRIYRVNDEVFRETNAIGQLATAWAALGDYARAFALIDTAIVRAEALDLRQEIASNIEVLASITRSAGDLDGALRLYDRARTFNEVAGRPLEQAADLRAEAELHHALGDTALARSKVLQALTLDRDVGSPLAMLRDLILMAEMESLAGNVGAAAKRMAESEDIVQALDARLPRVELALARARSLERRGHAARALDILDTAGRDVEAVGVDLAWQADLIRSRALARLDRLAEAASAGQRAVRTIERIRGRIGSSTLRTAFLSEQSTAHWHLADVLVRTGHVSEAFEVADAAHGRAILDHLGASEAGERAGLPRERFALVDRMDRLRESISGMHLRPRSAQDSTTLRALYDSLAAAHRAYNTSPSLPDVRARTTKVGILGGLPTRAEEVQQSLKSGEVLIEFLVGAESTLIFIVRSTGVAAVRSDLGTDAAFNLARVSRDLLSQPDDPLPSRVLGRLWTALIEPVERTGALRDAERVIIVRHGPFASFPFAALRKAPTDPWLAQQYELQVIPVAAALVVLRDAPPDRTPLAASTVFAPEPGTLPATRAEARAIARVRPGMRTRIGREATESAVRGVLGDGAAIVHLAAHAAFDTWNPLQSHIVLASGSQDADDDGRLEIRELIEISGRNTLVFLSACETGAGRAYTTAFARADDYATLAQAFLYAGARNVIATLWRIADDGAEVFATRFYRHLENHPIPRALALTQREMIEDPRYSAPFYWAGYQLAGEGGRVDPAMQPR